MLTNIKKVFNWFKLLFSETKNPLEVAFFRLKLKDNIIMKTSIGDFNLNQNNRSISIISSIMEYSKFFKQEKRSKKELENFKKFIIQFNDINLKIMDFNGLKFINNDAVIILKETFFDSGNSPFSSSLNDKIIVDIGANIADTALLFAHEGAEVFSFEPVPPIYDIAIKNINLNDDLKDKIHMYNYAISDKRDTLNISFSNELGSMASSVYSNEGTIFEVESITMEDIYNIVPNPDLLQMDCEGAEYDIVLTSDLSRFNEVLIEYHEATTGISHHVLINALEKQGFKIDSIFPCPGLFKREDIGIIRAIKN